MTEFPVPEFPVPDCLVLKIEEVERNTKKVDTTLYILYDKKYHNYVIRGRHRLSPQSASCEYSFVVENISDLVNFITFVIDRKNLWTYVLYNYDNLPIESDDITFEFLYNYDHNDYELGAYDNENYCRKRLESNLKMLRNVFNFYK
jgi:hypothetical protein